MNTDSSSTECWDTCSIPSIRSITSTPFATTTDTPILLFARTTPTTRCSINGREPYTQAVIRELKSCAFIAVKSDLEKILIAVNAIKMV